MRQRSILNLYWRKTMFDLIVALGGGVDRKVKAVQLLNQGLAPNILFTGDSNYKAEYAFYNIPIVSWTTPPFISTDTWSDGDVIREVLENNNWKSVAIVTSNYHLPRAWIILKKDMPKYTLAFYGVSSPFGASRVLSESGGILKAIITK
jgi:uncharacterized SAM-binding protein YcdF (DUF218 family)